MKRKWVDTPTKKVEVIETVNAFISQVDKRQLIKIGIEQNISVSVLIARAINNELASHTPFERKLTLDDPKADLTEQDDASIKLFAFISNHPSFGLEHLLILKADVGIETDQEVIRAYYHLIKVGIAREYYNKHDRKCIVIIEATKRQIRSANKREGV